MADITTIITETGCYLDNHRGHYIGSDTINLAVGYGFIIGSFEQFALGLYTEFHDNAEYPHEAMIELCDEAVAWLNSGQDKCKYCEDGFVDRSKWANVDYIPTHVWIDTDGAWRCKFCTGTGRAPRIEGQNFPPIIPEGYAWSFFDGDFGLYSIEEDLSA